VRVASFNVLHGLEDDGEETLEARLPLAADAIVGADVDVVGLQETTLTANHGDVTRRLAQALAARTGRTWAWCRFQSDPHFPGEADLAGGGEGGPLTAAMAANFRSGEAEWREMTAIVSRHPIVASLARRLPPRTYEASLCVPPDPTCALDAGVNSRVALWARVGTPAGLVDVVDTHLSHDLSAASETTKLLQAQSVLAFTDQLATPDELPDFVLGDFNSTEGSPAHAAVTGAGFRDSFRVAHPGVPGLTADQELHDAANTVTTRIDYVFVRPGACGLGLAASEVFPPSATFVAGQPLWPSDHYGVVSEVRCPAGAAGDPEALADSSGRATTGGGPGSLPATGGWSGPTLALVLMLPMLARRWRRQMPARRATTGARASTLPPSKTK
jgi:endonuclease/exonuclease/phosphatase family metal-dependent hydrolase